MIPRTKAEEQPSPTWHTLSLTSTPYYHSTENIQPLESVCVCVHTPSERSPFQHIRRRHQQGQRGGTTEISQRIKGYVLQALRACLASQNLSVWSTASAWNQSTHPIAFIRMNGGLNFCFWFSVAGSEDPAMSKKKGLNIQPSTPTRIWRPNREDTHTQTHCQTHHRSL